MMKTYAEVIVSSKLIEDSIKRKIFLELLNQQTERRIPHTLNEKTGGISATSYAINALLTWDSTTDGHNYWREIHDRVSSSELEF
jgi:hypothetical protein